MKRKGFTLIELLIVVAIISILASIAVPNFMEAQERSKVARAKADMRTYVTALETYYADNGTYIQSICPDSSLPGAKETWQWFSRLTTPVAYLYSITRDPFSRVEEDSWGGGEGLNPFHLYTGNGRPWDNSQAYADAPRKMYVILSLGPDGDYDMIVDAALSGGFVLYDMTAQPNYSGDGCYGWPYDTTNGTRSDGDLYKFSGDRPLPMFQGGIHPDK